MHPVLLVAGLSLVTHGVVTPQHAHAYTRTYRQVAREFGPRAPGRNILRWGTINHYPATDAQVVTSLGVLDRMLTPRTTPTRRPVASMSYQPVAPSGGLAACIVARESGGNPQAVNPNGHYGLGQWDTATWLAQGGGRYASTPLGASAAQQMSILNGALANGEASAWTPYDGC